MQRFQGVGSDFPTTSTPASTREVADEVRQVARNVRQIGRARGASPETILIEKHQAAEELFAIARRLECAR